MERGMREGSKGNGRKGKEKELKKKKGNTAFMNKEGERG